MMKFIKISLAVSTLILLMASCASNKNYGSRHSRYSSDRIAMMEKSKATKRVKESNRPTSDRNSVVTYAPSDTELSSYKKVRYHSERNSVLREANKYIGIPYVYGGKAPSEGFDCSGFVSYVYQKQSIPISGTAHSLSKYGHKKNPSELVAGDLVFFGTSSDISHVGIITLNDGDNLSMIHASSSNGIRSDNITHSEYWSEKLLFGVDILTAHFEEDLGMK